MKGFDIMKQVIPFQKELLFKTKVSEVTSISLEHFIDNIDNTVISGKFLVTGDYKMTEGSINREKFSFDIPFEISLDGSYDSDSIKMDIDNFYYEIINNEILKVNIDVYVTGELLVKELDDNVVFSDDRSISNNDKVIDVNDYNNDSLSDDSSIKYGDVLKVNSLEEDIDNDINISNDNSNISVGVSNIFDNTLNGDTYVTYYVYIVKEDDTLDKIINKFNVSREELSKYNDLDNIHKNVKLIIPNNE